MDDTVEKPDPPEPQTGPGHSGTLFWFLWALFFFVVIYPLSIGPAARIHQAQPAARRAIEALYKPVTALMDHSPPVRDFFLWYVEKVWRFDPTGPRSAAAPTNSAASGK